MLDLLQHYPRRWVDRTKKADIAELDRRRGGDGLRRGARRSAAAGRGRAARIVEAIVSDGTLAAHDHVLQPGVAREAAARRHRSVVLRQARRVPRQAPDDEPGRRRRRPRGRDRRQDRRDRPGLSAIGQGRGVHVAAAQDRRRGVAAVQGPRPSPIRSTKRSSTSTTSSTATPRYRGIHRPESMAEQQGRGPPADLRRVPAHAGRSRRAQARARGRAVGHPPRVDGPLVDASSSTGCRSG